jgi:hypothetical protein
MKSPLKPSPTLMQSPLKQANSLGSGSFLADEEIDTVFEYNPFQKLATASDSALWVLQPSGKTNSQRSLGHMEIDWDTFTSSFDAINTSISSSVSSSSSTCTKGAYEDSRKNSGTASCVGCTKKRVQWLHDENGEVACKEYEPLITDATVIRAQWYDAPSFRQFRNACHEVSLKASMDPDYNETFRHHLASCRRGLVPDHDTEDDVIQYASYRGLERAIFRQELQAAKYNAIHNTVAQQDDPFGNSVEALGETSRQWTATARHMARLLGQQDELIAQQAYKDSDETESVRRFIEI